MKIMKTNHILIALAIIAALSMVSCKNNNKKAQSQEPTQEEVQEMKQALADTVLAQIDEIAERFIDASGKTFRLRSLELTDAEKMVKPDYLLDPSVAATLVTKSQKINAMAFYVTEIGVRMIYDMPLDEVNEVIAKLAADLNYPLDIAYSASDAPLSEKIKANYEVFRESGNLAFFWQSHYAIIIDIIYLFVQNPELYFNKITEEQWQNFRKRIETIDEALAKLAQYDEEIALVWDFKNKNRSFSSKEKRDSIDQSIESAKQFRIANKDKFIARRNALLQ